MTKKKEVTIRSSAAEYLTFITATGEGGIEAIYADENVWLTQKMMGVLYNVETHTINYHLKKIFSDMELDENSVIRKFRITATDGKTYETKAFGNIVCFRNLEEATNKSLALFGDKEAGGIVLLKTFAEYYNGYTDDKLFQQQCAKASLEEAKKSTQLAEKNTKIAEENNEICKSALSKSIIANRLSFISIVIAIVSLVFAICK